jgi:HSP20 family protein
MFSSRWQQFHPVWGQLAQLQNEVNRIFDRWGGDGNRREPGGVFPPVNIWEEGDALRVEVELPGLDMKDVEIYVTGTDQLTLKGERKANLEKGTYHRQERVFGSFVRVLTLPVPVDADKVEARLENGVLQLKLPKHERAKPRKIAVKRV